MQSVRIFVFVVFVCVCGCYTDTLLLPIYIDLPMYVNKNMCNTDFLPYLTNCPAIDFFYVSQNPFRKRLLGHLQHFCSAASVHGPMTIDPLAPPSVGPSSSGLIMASGSSGDSLQAPPWLDLSS